MTKDISNKAWNINAVGTGGTYNSWQTEGEPVVIFETNFVNDSSYSINNHQLWDTVNKPEGWDGAQISGAVDNAMTGEAGLGVDSSVALKIKYDTGISQPTASLGKHLTGDINTGYDEVYVRVQVKLPDNFKIGNGIADVPYWKWGRLWQNTHPTDSAQWTENRADSFYCVWNFGGGETFGIDNNIVVGANSGVNLDQGSAGGERYDFDYYNGIQVPDYTLTPGHFEHVGSGDWKIDYTTNVGYLQTKTDTGSQDWHTIEIHWKLATDDNANDGIWQMWYDGIAQGTPVRGPTEAGGAPVISGDLPTSRHGSGINWLSFFDNLTVWNQDWDQAGVDGYILVNDVVISTQRIGHNYIAGSVS